MMAVRLPAFCAMPDNFRTGPTGAAGTAGAIAAAPMLRSRGALGAADLFELYLKGLRVDGRNAAAPVRFRKRNACDVNSSAVGSFSMAGRRTEATGACAGTP